MRKIKIDDSLLYLSSNYANTLFDNRTFEKKPLFSIGELILKYSVDIRPSYSHRKKVKYLELLKRKYRLILGATPKMMELLIDEFNVILHSDCIEEKFSKEIVGALRYSDVRDVEMLQIIKGLGINSCIYCNAQLATVIIFKEKKGNIHDRKGILELDHYYPKSKYPFLATSFFNLLPSCANCNKSKGKEKVEFYLYTDSNELECFEFELDKLSIYKYWRNRERENIKIGFKALNGKDELKNNHEDYFKITEIYETQKDIVEELLHKRIVYTKLYQEHLKDQYNSRLFPDYAMMNRLMIGNYDKPEEIHKRPMAKFTQDIAKQLGLIK